MGYHLFALSCLIQVNTMYSTNHSKLNRLIKVNIPKTLDLRVNDYTFYDCVPIKGSEPFNQNSDKSDREKWSASKGGPGFWKLFRLA